MLKNRATLEDSFQELAEQIATISKTRAGYIQHVCSVVRITQDHDSLSRMIKLLAQFIKSLPELRDFWMLFQTTADIHPADPSRGPVRVYVWHPEDMAIFHEALAHKQSLRRLSLISETVDDHPTVLLRMTSAMELFESLPNLETLSLRGCIPVPDAMEFKDLSKLSPKLSKLKIHNAGILRTHRGLPTDKWHFSVLPKLPINITRLALVLVDTSVPNLLALLSSAANTLNRLSLMGVFLTDSDQDVARSLNEDGSVRDPALARTLKPLKLGALSFGRVTCLTGGAAGTLSRFPCFLVWLTRLLEMCYAASPTAVGSLLRWLVQGETSSVTDLCLQASDSFGSVDVVNLLRGPQRPRSLKNLLWWHQEGIENPQELGAPDVASAGADSSTGTPSVPTSIALPDVEVQKACQEHGIRWLESLSDPLMDCLVQD